MAAQIVGGHEAFILPFICALLPGMDEGIEPEASLPKEELLLSNRCCPPSATAGGSRGQASQLQMMNCK